MNVSATIELEYEELSPKAQMLLQVSVQATISELFGLNKEETVQTYHLQTTEDLAKRYLKGRKVAVMV